MRVHLVNPSNESFGVALMTPRWLYVLAAATPRRCGDPILTDEMLEPSDPMRIAPGDVVGIGIHTGNALRGYEIGQQARERGATVVFGGIHATLYSDEAHDRGGAHAVVKGDGDQVWPRVLADCEAGRLQRIYEGGRISAGSFLQARWDLLPPRRYMWATVQTVRGCPKHCSFCSVWRTDGQQPRQRAVDHVLNEVRQLRRMGFRFIALADDNFYPVTLTDLAMADRREDKTRLHELQEIREDRFALMEGLSQLPDDTVFYTQITMEAGEDAAFLTAMAKAHIRGALIGVESVTPDGLGDVYKDFNATGDALVARLQAFKAAGVHVLGSFIFGLASDHPATFDTTAEIAQRAQITFPQFLMLTPLPGTIDFDRWERSMPEPEAIDGVPITRHWLIPQSKRPRVFVAHPAMSSDEILRRTQRLWDRFYSWSAIWERSRCVRTVKARLVFALISKMYQQMYANTGMATDSARGARSARWGRLIAPWCRRLFAGAAETA